ncbi:MAG: glycosyltransferase family 2 protein [Saprospiraceae bacterium]|nr:glycosyltransferase family 2 protein [Saprospiraceae bacterium]
MSDRVAICIPTYLAEAFITQTLTCAQNQTHQNLEIIISVDLSEDRTKDLCLDFASQDPRIRVLIQDSRQGWSQNANCAIKAATSPYFFIYFHDDIISDRYVEIRLQELSAHPKAASVHCDLIEFDLVEDIKPAHNYVGDPLNRVIDFLMTQRGTTLRSLVRKALSRNLYYSQQ